MTYLLAQPHQRRRQRRRGIALPVHAVEHQDKLVPPAQGALERHGERREVLAALAGDAVVERVIVAGTVDGPPACEQRALQQMSRGDALARGDDGVRGAEGAERGGDGEGLAGGARAVDDEGRRTGKRGLEGKIRITRVGWKGMKRGFHREESAQLMNLIRAARDLLVKVEEEVLREHGEGFRATMDAEGMIAEWEREASASAWAM